MLSQTVPAKGATKVSVGTNITLTFTTPPQQSDAFDSIALTLANDTEVTIQKNISGNTLTITPTKQLAYNTLYYLNVPSGALENTDDFEYKAVISFSFSTEPSPLTLVSTNPAAGSADVSRTSEITMEFNEELAFLSDTVQASFIKNSDKSSVAAIGTIDGNTVTFRPVTALDGLSLYRLTVPADSIVSVSGAVNQPISHRFTTTTFDKGDGTEENPYQINTVEDLVAFGQDGLDYKNKFIELNNDIVFNDVTNYDKWEWTSQNLKAYPRNTWKPKAEFHGSFNGNGHTIYGLYNQLTNTDRNGFIAYSYGTIKNLSLEKVMLKSTRNMTNLVKIGSLIGEYYGQTIHNCRVSGRIEGSAYDIAVGGLVGRWYSPSTGSTLSNCCNSAEITATSRYSDYTGWKRSYAGGLIGWLEDGSCAVRIDNCFNTGNIGAYTYITNGAAYAGGITGCVYESYITNCYNVGVIQAYENMRYDQTGDHAGAIAGYHGLRDTTCIIGCYSLLNCCSTIGKYAVMGTAVTEEALGQPETFADWDFDSVWIIEEAYNDGYPVLRCFLPTSICSFTAAKADNTVTATVAVEQLSENAVVWVASYTADGQLLEVKEVNADNKAELSATDVHHIKAFVWNMQSFIPLTDDAQCLI